MCELFNSLDTRTILAILENMKLPYFQKKKILIKNNFNRWPNKCIRKV